MQPTTVNLTELSKFHVLANTWWDSSGPLKTLHHINPIRLDWVLSFGSVRERSVLDVGCGGGIFSEALAKQGATVVGIDAEASAIQVASEHAKDLNLPLTYVATSIEAFHGEAFDIITCFELLEHVDEPQRVIKEAANRLKPGGLLFLSTINRTAKAYVSAIVMAEYVLRIVSRQTHDYAKFIRPSELAKMARQAGLEQVELIGMGYHPFTEKAFLMPSVDVNYFMLCRKI